MKQNPDGTSSEQWWPGGRIATNTLFVTAIEPSETTGLDCIGDTGIGMDEGSLKTVAVAVVPSPWDSAASGLTGLGEMADIEDVVTSDFLEVDVMTRSTP
jgi:hypothetical protein